MAKARYTWRAVEPSKNWTLTHLPPSNLVYNDNLSALDDDLAVQHFTVYNKDYVYMIFKLGMVKLHVFKIKYQLN